MTEICFKDLSMPLKFAIVISYVLGVIGGISFLVGFMQGVTGGY